MTPSRTESEKPRVAGIDEVLSRQLQQCKMSAGAGGRVGLREGKNKGLVQEGKKAHLKQVGLLCVCESLSK